MPVEVLGFTGTPGGGRPPRGGRDREPAPARSPTIASARSATNAAGARRRRARLARADDERSSRPAGRKEFPLVIKGDVQGSVEAIVGSLDKLGTDEVARPRASTPASAASPNPTSRWPKPRAPSIIGFNVRAHKEAREAAERDGIEIRYYNIIYDLVDDVKAAMSGLLRADAARDHARQRARSSKIFNVSKVGKIAGCRVTDGTVERGANVRLIRDNVVVHEGKLSQLKRFKDDAQGSHGRPGMRHGLRELPGHARRRRHRVLPGGDGSALAVSPRLAQRLNAALSPG